MYCFTFAPHFGCFLKPCGRRARLSSADDGVRATSKAAPENS
jgi:hypothetical protein